MLKLFASSSVMFMASLYLVCYGIFGYEKREHTTVVRRVLHVIGVCFAAVLVVFSLLIMIYSFTSLE